MGEPSKRRTALLETVGTIVVSNHIIDFNRINNMLTFKEAASHLVRHSLEFRAFIETRIRQSRSPATQPKQHTNRSGCQAQPANEKQHKVDTFCLTLQGQGVLMFCPVVLHNTIPTHGLIDTGATITIISTKLANPTNQAIYQSSNQLRCANKTKLPVAGDILLDITLGSVTTTHECCVSDHVGHNLIIGNDLLKLMRAKPNPHRNILEMSKQTSIPCLSIQRDSSSNDGNEDLSRPTSTEVEPAPDSKDYQVRFQAYEPLPVLPVFKEGFMYLPVGRSTVIPAKQSKTSLYLFVPTQLEEGWLLKCRCVCLLVPPKGCHQMSYLRMKCLKAQAQAEE